MSVLDLGSTWGEPTTSPVSPCSASLGWSPSSVEGVGVPAVGTPGVHKGRARTRVAAGTTWTRLRFSLGFITAGRAKFLSADTGGLSERLVLWSGGHCPVHRRACGRSLASPPDVRNTPIPDNKECCEGSTKTLLGRVERDFCLGARAGLGQEATAFNYCSFSQS